MGILAELRILVVLLCLKLVFHSAVFCHHFGARDLHVVDDEFVSEEGVLFVLALKVRGWNQNFLDVLEHLVLFVL